MAIRIKKKYQGRQREINHDKINEDIRFPKLLVIKEEGQKPVEMDRKAALALSLEMDLDLILITDKGNLPVVKIADYGKFKYERKKKAQAAKKNQTVVETKQIRLTPRIGDHDLGVKEKQARKALESGNKVMISMRFRYQEKMNDQEPGKAAMAKLIEMLDDVSTIAKAPKWRNMFYDTYLDPKKKK